MLSRLIAIAFLGALLITDFASGEELATADTVISSADIRDTILALHRSKNGKFMVWNECGKVVRGDDVRVRADRYAELILASIRSVKAKTGFEVPYRDVVAVLFRESSHNECCVGKQEIAKLSKDLGHEPEKEDVISHVKGWYRAQDEASKWCRQQPTFSSTCKSDYIAKKYSQYVSITGGWDLGAAQYRFPNAYLRKRSVAMPDGRVVSDIGLSDLMQLDVTIQLLVEDLAMYHGVCAGHEHWLMSKWGHKVRKLSVDEAYYVHHHRGQNGWSWDYWRRMQDHFRVIDKMKQASSEISLMFSRMLFGKIS